MLTEEQLKLRKGGIGSSEIAAVAGLNPWSSPLNVYLDKMGLVEDNSDTFHTERGTFLEPGLRSWYSRRTDRDVEECTTLVHPTIPLVRGTPDGRITKDGVLYGALELKSPGWRTAHHWGEPGTDEIPDYYVPQVIWEMALLEAERADVAAFIDGDLRIYTVPWDGGLFGALVEIASKFWRDHIELKEPPKPDGSERARQWLDERYPIAKMDMVELAGPDNEPLLHKLMSAKDAKKRAEEDEEIAKQQIKALIGDHEGAVTPFGKIYWRNSKGRTSTDWKAIAEEMQAPESIIAKHTRAAPGTRSFRPYLKSE